MLLLAHLIVFALAAPVLAGNNTKLLMTGVELARQNGYACEVLEVTTKDGYILQNFRILPVGPSKGVVVLLHGLAGSADNFLLLGKGRSLAYVLAEAGYDVYLVNFRGNLYSSRHVKLKPDEKEFWQFTFDEMATYDVPATLKLAKATSGADRVFVLGHSMGATVFYTMLATQPEEQSHIRAAFMLAPCVYAFNMKNPLGYFTFNMPDTYTDILAERGPYAVAKRAKDTVAYFLSEMCQLGSPYNNMCFNIITYLSNSKDLPKDKLIFFLLHMFGGTSVNSFIHLTQIYKTKRFAAYDYGVKENMRRYGSVQPPEYKFVNITVPISLHYSESDRETPPEDVLLLQNVSSNNIGTMKIPLPEYSHFDFILSDSNKEVLYDPIVAIMKLY